MLVIAAVAAAAGACLLWKHTQKPWRPVSEDLTTPKLAIANLSEQPVFFSPLGRDWLARVKPAAIPPPARDSQSAFSKRLSLATQGPVIFRELDREVRFSAVWLLGEPSWFKTLMEHLLETKDFSVTYVDHTSIIFRRGGDASALGDPLDGAKAFQDPREHAFYLAQTGTRLALLRQGEAAARCLQAAEERSSSIPDVWSAWSTYRMTKGDWDHALDAADRALALDASFIPGVACKAQSLFAMKRFLEAYKLSERLVASSPDDPATLFYHAKLAHEARAFDAEVEALQHLVAVGEKAGSMSAGIVSTSRRHSRIVAMEMTPGIN